MMISSRFKCRTIMIAFLMLFVIGFSVKDSNAGIAPVFPEPICPGQDIQVGWVDLTVTDPGGANFIGADLFLAESFPGFVTGGVDWFYASIFSFTGGVVFPDIDIVGNDLVVRGSLLNTTITGSQLISKYNQKEGRNTFIEVANTARGVCQFGLFPFRVNGDQMAEAAQNLIGFRQFGPAPRECGDNIDCLPTANECNEGTCIISGTACATDFDCAFCVKDNVEVHVEVLDENCNEVCNFCDAYTPVDKHVYDLGNLVRNIDGSAVGCGNNTQGREGIFTVTAVKNCTASIQQARDFNFLAGDMHLIDSRINVDYGENLQTRLAISARGSCRVDGSPCFFDQDVGLPDSCPGDNCEGPIIGFCNTDGGDQCFSNADCDEQGFFGVPCVSTGGEGPATLGTCSLTGSSCQNFIDPRDVGCDDNGFIDCFTGSCQLSLATCQAFETCVDNNECVLDGSACADHCLTGELGCQLVSYVPNNLRKDFWVTPGSVAGADVVKLAFRDTYAPPGQGFSYTVAPAFVTYAENICDDAENCNSCGVQTACYARLGIDDELQVIDPPNPVVSPTPTPTPSPTPTPTPTPCTEDDDCPAGFICGDFVEPDMGVCIPGCTVDHPCPTGEICVDIDPETGIGMCEPIPPSPTVTPTVSPSGKQGSSGSCTSVAGAAPVQLGTAMANILIPLLPALAIGIRMIRRRRKEQK